MDAEKKDQTLLSLKKNVLHVFFDDPTTGSTISKIISINGRKTYTPINRTAALLLYLLPCDGEDPILLSDFLRRAQAKFKGSSVDNIMSFLDKLEGTYGILSAATGTSGSADPDPLHLFPPLTEEEKAEWQEGEGNEENWETPGLEMGSPPVCKATTIFFGGYMGGRIPKRPEAGSSRIIKMPQPMLFGRIPK